MLNSNKQSTHFITFNLKIDFFFRPDLQLILRILNLKNPFLFQTNLANTQGRKSEVSSQQMSSLPEKNLKFWDYFINISKHLNLFLFSFYHIIIEQYS